MRELNLEETGAVAGGAVPVLLGILAFEWYQMDNIQDFVEGFFDGLED